MSRILRTDSYGFRLRGGENTRIEAFTDAAFAFAVTLLVIGGAHAPANIAELLDALSGVPAYAASFALLCLFWYAHYSWFLRYGVEDGRTVLLSLVLVFVVLIYVYPLHMLFSAAFVGPDVDSTSTRIAVISPRGLASMFVVYGVAYATLCSIVVLFHVHAWRLRDALDLDPGERLITRRQLARWSINAGIGLLSAALALAIPHDAPPAIRALPGVVYLLHVFTGGLWGRRLRRQVAAMRANA